MDNHQIEEMSDEEDFVQELSSGDDEEEAIMDQLEKNMELSYKQRMEELSQHQRSRPESTSTTGGGCRSSSLGVGIARLRSAQMRPSDLKPFVSNNPYSQASGTSNPNIAVEEEKVINFTENSIQVLQPVVEELVDVYARFESHVRARGVMKDSFCRAIHLYVTKDELKQCFQKVGFPISNDDIADIFRDFQAQKTGYLPMDSFYDKLNIWRAGNLSTPQIIPAATQLTQPQQQQVMKPRPVVRRRPITAKVMGAKNYRSVYSIQPPQVPASNNIHLNNLYYLKIETYDCSHWL